MSDRITNILKLIVALVIPLGLGALAGMVTSEAIPEWYATLNRPSFSPPNWLFGPVWTILYILLGISFFLVWKEAPGKNRNRALLIFGVQMVLNFAWTFIFFYFKMLQLALMEILLLWLSILVMMLWFYRVKPLAAYLNIPYILWVTFATVLNAGYYFLNS
ncbi:TspO/MBR family protein [Geofilum rubicundum]|uniref:Benzodiazepine receptor TspO n=1 Tax=Geofilum rubicundum JCM 15548 TaxID=1236989 RepID=A0A0E9LZ36_9BACT|nr:TspO/MBR family protein [Geofilum rubicundum]GAO30135.1 benzodiazepine receptor TspO [Geofilum rubicundum JCM 15548]